MLTQPVQALFLATLLLAKTTAHAVTVYISGCVNHRPAIEAA